MTSHHLIALRHSLGFTDQYSYRFALALGIPPSKYLLLEKDYQDSQLPRFYTYGIMMFIIMTLGLDPKIVIDSLTDPNQDENLLRILDSMNITRPDSVAQTSLRIANVLKISPEKLAELLSGEYADGVVEQFSGVLSGDKIEDKRNLGAEEMFSKLSGIEITVASITSFDVHHEAQMMLERDEVLRKYNRRIAVAQMSIKENSEDSSEDKYKRKRLPTYVKP